VHDYDGGCCYDGSQYGGDQANPVLFENMYWADQNGVQYTPSMGPTQQGYAGLLFGGSTIGSSMTVWDVRC